MIIKPSAQNWHVVYTLPKTEKKVATSISDLGLESYLPLQKVVRQWSDRKKKIEVPLFPNYVFVKVDALMRGHLYSIKELVKFVSIERKPVVVSENVISSIKRVMNGSVEVSGEEYFQNGMKVRIKYGQFSGLEGVIFNKRGKTRLVIKIDELMRAFSFDVPYNMVETLEPDSRMKNLRPQPLEMNV